IKSFISYNPQNPADQFDIAATQKNMLNLITEIPDVYIVDKHNYQLLVMQGAFKQLDDWKNILPEERLLTNTGPDDEQAYIYGVDLSDLAFWDELRLYGTEERIVALRFDTDNSDNILLFINRLLGI